MQDLRPDYFLADPYQPVYKCWPLDKDMKVLPLANYQSCLNRLGVTLN